MYKFSDMVTKMRSSEIRKLMKMAANPDVISFSGGMPNPELFPVERLEKIYKEIPLATKQAGFQYCPTAGYPPLIQILKNYLAEKGLPLEGNDLIITTGAQQAINLVTRVFVDPGDRVISEFPCFIGAAATFNSYQADMTTIPIDKDGPDPGVFEQALSLTPAAKLVYLTPFFHNPAGIIYSHERKQSLIEILCQHKIVLLEDDPYGELYFDEKDKELTVPIKALAGEKFPICYAGSFSKIIGPGLRLGWLLAPSEIIEKCELAKQSMDACSSTYSQVLAFSFMESGALPDYLAFLRAEYKERAQIMLDAMKEYMPDTCTWTIPRGGFYIWVTLPEHMDATEILTSSLQKGAVFVIGKAFDPENRRNNCLRLAFSHTPKEKIATGTSIIANAIKMLS